MKIRTIFVVVIILFLAGISTCVYAQGKSSAREKAKSRVLKVVEFVEANGPEAAIAEINKQDGQFVENYSHVFAYDLKGNVIADPFRVSIRGKNVLREVDSKGKYFRKEIIERAKTKGEGWVEYTYYNSTKRKYKPKAIYFKKVGEMIICSNAY